MRLDLVRPEAAARHLHVPAEVIPDIFGLAEHSEHGVEVASLVGTLEFDLQPLMSIGAYPGAHHE